MATDHRRVPLDVAPPWQAVPHRLAYASFALAPAQISDPVRKSTDETWGTKNGRQALEIGDGEGTLGYCQEFGGDTCLTGDQTAGFYVSMKNVSDYCDLSMDEFITYAADCSKLTNHPVAACRALGPSCKECDRNCKAQWVADIKSYMEPAAINAMITFFFMVVTAVSNHMLTSTNTYGFIDFKDKANAMGALVMNGIVIAAGLALIIVGSVTMSMANEACKNNSDEDCAPSISFYIILLGVLAMITAGLVLVGIGKAINLLIKIANVAMIVASIMLLFGTVFIALASGTVMKDLSSNYDNQFNAIKHEMEQVEPAYCDFKYDPDAGIKDCFWMTQNKTNLLNKKDNRELDVFEQEWVQQLRDHQYHVMNSGALPFDNNIFKKYIACKRDEVCESCGFDEGGMFNVLNLQKCQAKEDESNAIKNFKDYMSGAPLTSMYGDSRVETTNVYNSKAPKVCNVVARIGWCNKQVWQAKAKTLEVFQQNPKKIVTTELPAIPGFIDDNVTFASLCPRSCGPWPKSECRIADEFSSIYKGGGGASYEFPKWRQCACSDEASTKAMNKACGCKSWERANNVMEYTVGVKIGRTSQESSTDGDCDAGAYNADIMFPFIKLGAGTACGRHLAAQITPKNLDKVASTDVNKRASKNLCEIALLSACKVSNNYCLPCSAMYFDEDVPATKACLNWLGMKVDMTCRPRADCLGLFMNSVESPTGDGTIGEDYFKELQALLDGANNGFCDMPDQACRQKLKYATQKELSSMAKVGGTVLFFMLIVMWITQMVVSYWWKHKVKLDKKAEAKKEAFEARRNRVAVDGEPEPEGPPPPTVEERREKLKHELKRLDAQKELGIIDELTYEVQREAIMKQAGDLTG